MAATLGKKWVGPCVDAWADGKPTPAAYVPVVDNQFDLIGRDKVKAELAALVDEYNAGQTPAPPVTFPTLWEQAGVLAYTWQNFDGNAAKAAKAAGFSWLAGLEHEGALAPAPNGHVSDAQVAAWRASGLRLGCYGYCNGDPVRVAEAAHGVIEARGYTFYIANAEGDTPRGFDRPFLARFRELQPSLPLGLSTNPDDPRDWAAWQEAGALPLFQSYVNINATVTPAECAFKATQHGWQAKDSKPTVGIFPHGTPVGGAGYVALLDQARASGFSVWAGEYVQPADWAAFSAGIREKGIAR